MSSTDTLFQTVPGVAITESAKQRVKEPGAAATIYAEILGTVHEVGEVYLTLGTDSKPTELKNTLHIPALPFEVFIMWNINITSYFVNILEAYPFKWDDDVPNPLNEMFQNELYAWDLPAMVCIPAQDTMPDPDDDGPIVDIIGV